MKGGRRPPVSCFWELTRRCELSCLHCRVPNETQELSLPMALALADQLIKLGVGLVVLTGGEPTLYNQWQEVAYRLSAGGIKVRLFTSGLGFQAIDVDTCLQAGVAEVAISLDGPRFLHDKLRPLKTKKVASTFDEALRAAQLVQAAGLPLRLVTQINRMNVEHLAETAQIVSKLGAKWWQVHLVQITGRAREYRAELLPAPDDLETLVALLVEEARRETAGIKGAPRAPLHCTVGYMTAEETVLRGRGTRGRIVWGGCLAGLSSLAITCSGGVKGCIALPDEFVTANVLQRSLADIWSDNKCFPYSREWSATNLEAECAHCHFGRICRAGCPAVAYGATGSIGANPFCLTLVRKRDQ